ncbi:MAG: adenylosuccinate synthetase, partial [Gordonia amarae]
MNIRDKGAPIIVVGLGYGDESKGATVDYLASTIRDTAAVVRWSGGAQAAHNVCHGPRHHTFRQFGSGTLRGVRTI